MLEVIILRKGLGLSSKGTPCCVQVRGTRTVVVVRPWPLHSSSSCSRNGASGSHHLTGPCGFWSPLVSCSVAQLNLVDLSLQQVKSTVCGISRETFSFPYHPPPLYVCRLLPHLCAPPPLAWVYVRITNTTRLGLCLVYRQPRT